MPKETASCNKDTESLTSLTLGFRGNCISNPPSKILKLQSSQCRRVKSHTLRGSLTHLAPNLPPLQLDLYHTHLQHCAMAPLPFSNPTCQAQLDGPVCSLPNSCSYCGASGSKRGGGGGAVQHGCVAEKKDGCRGIPGNISKIPFQKVQSKISS